MNWWQKKKKMEPRAGTGSYTHLRAHETEADLVCRLLLEKKKEHQKNAPRSVQFLSATAPALTMSAAADITLLAAR